MEMFKKYWPVALALVTILGGVTAAGRFQGQLEYITDAVNPETISEYRVLQREAEIKRDLRWCFGKAKLQGKDFAQALDCLD